MPLQTPPTYGEAVAALEAISHTAAQAQWTGSGEAAVYWTQCKKLAKALTDAVVGVEEPPA